MFKMHLSGTLLEPRVSLDAPYGVEIRGKSVKDWLNKNTGGAHWDKPSKQWILHGFSATVAPSQFIKQTIEKAGITFSVEESAPPVDELWRPVVFPVPGTLDHVSIYPRLFGQKGITDVFGPAAVFNQRTGLFIARASDLVHQGKPHPALLNSDFLPEMARRASSFQIGFPEVAAEVAQLARHTGFDPDRPTEGLSQEARNLIEKVSHYTGKIPDWFGLDLFPFQTVGVYATAGGHRLLTDEPGLGKGSTPDTRIRTMDGWSTYGGIKPGDIIAGSNGKGTLVTGKFRRGVLDLWRVTTDDGASTSVDPDHLWLADGKVQETRSLAVQVAHGHHPHLPVVAPIQTTAGTDALPIDPYVVGSLIASSRSGQAENLTSVSVEHFRALAAALPRSATLREAAFCPLGGGKTVGDFVLGSSSPAEVALIDASSVSIPSRYLLASLSERERLLQGIMDTLMPRPGAMRIRESLVEDVTELVNSLGGTLTPTSTREGVTSLKLRLPKQVRAHLVERAWKSFQQANLPTPSRRIVSVEPAGRGEVICISVAATDSLYVTEGHLVTHNTRQGLGFAAVNGPQRTLLIVPPLVASNWAKEGSAALGPYWSSRGLPDPTAELKKKSHKGMVTDPYGTFVIRPTRKNPKALPDEGVLVIPYTTIGNAGSGRNKDNVRLVEQLVEWSPTSIVIDEAHLHRNYSTARSAYLRVFCSNFPGRVVAATGTPIVDSAGNLPNQMALTGQVLSVFGSARAFFSRFCKINFFGKVVDQKDKLPGLKEILDRRIWVFRRKSDVLVQMPPKLRTVTVVDIKQKDYETAHQQLAESILEWIESFRAEHQGRYPHEGEIEEWASTRIDMLTPLRVAAGRAKIPAAVEIVGEWLESHKPQERTSADGSKILVHDDPLLVWFHHSEVMHEFLEELAKAHPEAATMYGSGETPQDRRGQIQDEYQEGKYALLACTIGGFGYGITLTRCYYEIFVETGWSPSDVTQAEDRAHRIGQQNAVLINNLVAENTLDPMVRGIQHGKSTTLGVLREGGDIAVSEVDANYRMDENGNLVIEEILPSEREAMLIHGKPSDILKNIALQLLPASARN